MNLTAIFLRPFKQRLIYVFGADVQLNSQVQNKGHRSQVQFTALLINNWDKQFPLKAAGETYLWINSKVKALLLRHVLNRLYHGCCRGDLDKILRWILGHKLSEKPNFETPEGFPTEARVPSKIFMQVDSFGTYAYSCRICPLEFFIGFRIISYNVLRIFEHKKRRVPYYIELKTPEIGFTIILSPFNLLLLNKHFVSSLRAIRAREHFKLCAHVLPSNVYSRKPIDNRPHPHVSGYFLKTEIFSPFSKTYASTRRVFESFSPFHTKMLKQWKYDSIHYWACVMLDSNNNNNFISVFPREYMVLPTLFML